MTNSYLKDPIKVIIYDPRGTQSDPVLHTFVYLGDVGRHIVDACNSGNAKILRDYYGSEYKTKLGMKPAEDITLGGRVGGEDTDSDYDDIEELLNSTDVKVDVKSVEIEPGVTYVTAYHIFPEDNFAELKEKIYITCGIPVYRQHLFFISKGRYNTTYDIIAEGLYSTDIRNISATTDRVYNLPIDKGLYELRDVCHVNALDTFKILIT